MGLGPGQNRESLGQQPVAGQNRGCLVEGDVNRRAAAPQVAVVHRRQIVVDQAVAVDHLDGGTDPERLLLGNIEEAGRFAHQEGPQAFAARQRGIAHRFDNAPARPVGRREQPVEQG